MIDYLRLRRELLSAEGANASELAAALEAADALQTNLEHWRKLGGSVQAEDQQLQDLAKTLDIPPMPEDDGGHSSTRVTWRWVIHVLDQRVTSLRTALAEQGAQLAHQTEVIAANQTALAAAQSDCAAVLTERDARIETLRAMLERCVGATVTVEVPQDPRYKHILSGDYYEPGKKDGA